MRFSSSIHRFIVSSILASVGSLGSSALSGNPIPPATPAQQKPIIELVDRILALKAADATADTAALESQIDELVFDLYGLTADERAIVSKR